MEVKEQNDGFQMYRLSNARREFFCLLVECVFYNMRYEIEISSAIGHAI